ncbi:MAG: MBL fold metallo-hydrolase [Bdellovibrionales bacterium]|nr:MBL fold metallo-hydrolase [Bdellovibrionales bacterium]
MTFLEKNIVVGPFQCNCRLLMCPVTGDAALIDPGDEAAKILAALAKAEIRGEGGKVLKPRLRWLLHTHAHLDHIGGTRGVVEGMAKEGSARNSDSSASVGADAPPVIALHKDDEFIYRKLKEQGQMFGMKYDDPLPVGKFLEHGERLELGKLKLEIIHTPGHSPGSLGIRLHEDSALGAPETVFSGDTLFQGSVGRTDLWGADGDLMFKMIRERLFTLDGDTRVCPGHGPSSTVGREKTGNPFFQ